MEVYDETIGNADSRFQKRKSLPNATAVLVLGILSIVATGIGFILAIIALVLHQKDKEVYLRDKASYKVSFDTSKAGFICAIIGIATSVLSGILIAY